MGDIWSFLLQTLTASGVAALLLAAKAMLRDKLSPRWQFSVWGLLALVLLIPAGLGGRYVLVNWPLAVETARSLLTGEYGALTRVTAPVPLPLFDGPPRTGAAWLHCAYAVGAALLLGRCAVSYIRLRRALRRGRPAGDIQAARVRAVAERYGLPTCPAVEADGLSSAFICGVFRPVLALPAGVETDEKVLLHELLHLKHHDAAWGLVICLFRCIHWCNPLLWHCADLAANDLEALCDQRVLERLEGEDRRDYGRILLSMANEKYARAAGTSSMANGGKNIRRRIESIARFKKYPAGMGLAAVCTVLVLAGPCLTGSRAQAPYRGGSPLPAGLDAAAAMASARTTYCTTFAGAFDTYARAVLDKNILYRAMCAPLAEQNALAEQLRQAQSRSAWPPESGWDAGLEAPRNVQAGYEIYNLFPAESGYEGLLAVELTGVPEGETWDGTVHSRWMAVQPLRAEREGNRWGVRPLGEPYPIQGDVRSYGNIGLPARVYEARFGDFTLRLRLQTTSHVAESRAQTDSPLFSTAVFAATPRPNGEFTDIGYDTSLTAVYTGDPAKRGEIRSIGVSCAPASPDAARPELRNPGTGNSTGSSSNGEEWGTQDTLRWENGNEIFLSGGGGGFAGSGAGTYAFPESYAADLYLNGKKAAALTLLPVEGGLQ